MSQVTRTYLKLNPHLQPDGNAGKKIAEITYLIDAVLIKYPCDILSRQSRLFYEISLKNAHFPFNCLPWLCLTQHF